MGALKQHVLGCDTPGCEVCAISISPIKYDNGLYEVYTIACAHGTISYLYRHKIYPTLLAVVQRQIEQVQQILLLSSVRKVSKLQQRLSKLESYLATMS